MKVSDKQLKISVTFKKSMYVFQKYLLRFLDIEEVLINDDKIDLSET